MIRKRNRRFGFTLLELMMVVTIVGILTATVLPSYTRLLDRVREVEVVSLFSAGCMAEFMNFLEHGQFSSDTKNLLITIPPATGWVYPGTADNPLWTVTSEKAEIIATSTLHGQAHQIRGSVNSQGTWLIEIKRPGETLFRKLGT